MKNIAVTHPGKLGDLVYSLPTIRDLSAHFETALDMIISPQCVAIKPLLAFQPYIKSVVVDQSYVPLNQHRGYQPYSLNLDDAQYDKVFHLGYRAADDYPLETSSLRQYGYYILQKEYGISLKQDANAALVLPDVLGEPSEILFQGTGETLEVVLGSERVNKILLEWTTLLKSSGKKIVAISGPREAEWYRKLGFEVLVPRDLFETALLISGSKLVVTVQSVVAAIANELSHQRIVLSLFPNAQPSTPNGVAFPISSDVNQKMQVRDYLMRF